MEIRALGVYGNQLLRRKTTTFMINHTLLIDAGAITASLTLKEQANINNIILTHSHADHIKDIAFLADNVIGRKQVSISIYGSKTVIEDVKNHYLNDKIWPDFTIIPSTKNPVFKYEPIEVEKEFSVCGLKVFPVRMNHPVFTTGLIVSNGKVTVAFTSDTGPTERFWEIINGYKKIDALFIETSFPSELEDLANVSGHLTPKLLNDELRKFKFFGQAKIFVYHIKPAFERKVKRELIKLNLPNFHIIRQGEILKL